MIRGRLQIRIVAGGIECGQHAEQRRTEIQLVLRERGNGEKTQQQRRKAERPASPTREASLYPAPRGAPLQDLFALISFRKRLDCQTEALNHQFTDFAPPRGKHLSIIFNTPHGQDALFRLH